MTRSREEVLRSSIPHPEFEKVVSQAKKTPLPSDIDVVTIRNISNSAKAKARSEYNALPAGLREWDIEIPTRDGKTIPAWVYDPSEGITAEEMPILLFFHGGGFCIGNRHDDFESNRAIALNNKILVVSVEYRLAPEYPFPTAVHDGLDSLQWIAANSHKIHKLASPSRGLIVGGTSAGGSIANAVIYLNYEQATPVPITGQFLSVPPLLPPHLVPKQYKNDYLSNEQNEDVSNPPPELIALFMDAYKPDPSSPLFSPFNRSAGRRNIPPTYLQACGADVLRDDALIYERVLREEFSIATRLDLYSGLPHHFWEFYPQLKEPIQQRTDDTVAGIGWLLEMSGLESREAVN